MFALCFIVDTLLCLSGGARDMSHVFPCVARGQKEPCGPPRVQTSSFGRVNVKRMHSRAVGPPFASRCFAYHRHHAPTHSDPKNQSHSPEGWGGHGPVHVEQYVHLLLASQ